ncbi:Clp1/GlmU family protein [Thermococcus sp.]|uniref:Clp1/GlmU family protein n=1 Tax=Thermococcus sp. TaxID=35749 RepID=UPI00261561FB|nr:Clp1/GlmU family protein [Thermococcus sp.]
MNKASYTTDVPDDRFELLDVLLRSPGRPLRVMVVGGTDSGKTTLVTFLANELLHEGLRVALVDSDVGQKGILPPATVSLALPEEYFSNPGELVGIAHYFIGTISPGQYVGEMAIAVKRLTEIASSIADVVLVDTTGFVTGPGAEMKRLKAELVRPDLTVVLEHDGELDYLVRLLSPHTTVLRLGVSPSARKHSAEERRSVRAEKWRGYFEGSSLVEVNLNEVPIGGTSLFQGRPLSGDELELLSSVFGWLVLAGWKGERYTVVKSDVERFQRHYSRLSLRAVDFEKLGNLLVGFIDETGLCLGLGLLKWINFTSSTVQILTPLSEEELGKAVELRFGRIRLLETGEELGLLGRDEL